MEEVIQQVLEQEMEETLQAGKGERTATRQGYRSGYYNRTLITRVGKLELRVPQDRQGRFRTDVFERGHTIPEYGALERFEEGANAQDRTGYLTN